MRQSNDKECQNSYHGRTGEHHGFNQSSSANFLLGVDNAALGSKTISFSRLKHFFKDLCRLITYLNVA